MSRMKGVRLNHDDMRLLRVPARVGARFETDLLDVDRAMYEIVRLDEEGALVIKVTEQPRTTARSGTMPRVLLPSDEERSRDGTSDG